MDLGPRIAALSDLAAVTVCQELAAALLTRSGFSLDAAAGALPPELATNPELIALRTGLDERYHTALTPEVSVPLARSMLEVAAADPELAPTLEVVLDAHRDTKQFVLEVLALGAAVSMVIIAATTTVEHGQVGKKVLPPGVAHELGAWLTALAPWATGRDAANKA
jgi:hypothetical protein